MIGRLDFLQAVQMLRSIHPLPLPKYRFPLIDREPLGVEEIAAAMEALVCGPVTQGWRVKRFEDEFAKAHGRPEEHAVFCNSGSSANLLAVAGLALQPGEEVITSAVGWPTTVWPIVQCGGVPVFADVDPSTMNVTHNAFWKCWRPPAYRCFLVHLMGNPLPLREPTWDGPEADTLEDCCEALDAEIRGQKVGSFGRFGTFSFYISHHITTIEGGMVLCRDKADADRIRQMRDHGLTRSLPWEKREVLERQHPDIDSRFLFTETGYNLRGDEIRAAIGLVQFAKRIPWIQKRRDIAKAWTDALDEDVFQPIQWAPGAVPFAFPLVCRGDYRAKLLAYLESHGIENRPLVAGNMALQAAMRKVKHRIVGDLPGANFLHTHACYIGIHPDMSDGEFEQVGEILREFRP